MTMLATRRRAFEPDEIDLAGVLPALEGLERRVNRLSASCGQLIRALDRRGMRQQDPANPALKRRVPQIRKNLTMPGEGLAFLEEATAARKAGKLDEFVWPDSFFSHG